MIGRWVLRATLVVAAFFIGSWAMFFLLFLVTWDQELVDALMPIAGVAAAAVAYFKTKPLTRAPADPKEEAEPVA